VTLIRDRISEKLLSSIQDTKPVKGLTHFFYRYPARFSPQFARAAIECFSEAGDLVLDPFMGSGTTIIESRVLGRRSIGTDISQLACFIAKVKSSVYTSKELSEFENWAQSINASTKDGHAEASQPPNRNLHTKETWPVRAAIERILNSTHYLNSPKLMNLARCAILKTSQWALDCRSVIPSAADFRLRFQADVEEMSKGALEFSLAAKRADRSNHNSPPLAPVLLNRSVIGMEEDPMIKTLPVPDLLLTSPPYPGVHILYHRWQIQGRKETDAPFWISNTNDGAGASFYTFGDRKNKSGNQYFSMLLKAFTSLAMISGEKTWVVQLVSFSDPRQQLHRYLHTMAEAGFQEIFFSNSSSSDDGRIWRVIPNRKWYNNSSVRQSSKLEVVLFHRLA
jgi:hypothetical protein